MTEGNDDGNYLVRVRAQVMMHDDSMGGWVPLGGGGLSNVSVRKRTIQSDPDDSKHEYLIYGKRISDQSVVLSCIIKKDFEYNKVMPTFHHWRTGDHKFGLTFQTAADARAFDKGVRMAVEDLLDGLVDYPSLPYGQNIDDVFMPLNLPMERDGSRSSSGSVTTCSSRHTPTTTPLPTPDHPSHYHHHHLSMPANTSVPAADIPHYHMHHHHYSAPTLPSDHLHTHTIPSPPLPIPDHSTHHHLHRHIRHHVQPSGGGGGGSIGVSTTNTSPSSTISNTTTVGTNNQTYNFSHSNHLHKITFMPRTKPGSMSSTNPPDKVSDIDCDYKHVYHPSTLLEHDKIEVSGDNYSYVEFAKEQPPSQMPHEYSYPVVEGLKGDRRDSISSIKKNQREIVGSINSQGMQPPLLPTKSSRKREHRSGRQIKARCAHCNDIFTDDLNVKGSCEYAPDYVRSTIEKLTCMSCAHCMLYHCMSNSEGEFAHHPCECRGDDGVPDESCWKRWLGLTFLSIFVPCLCCYLPLRGCHNCAVYCGLCGGRHQTSSSS